MESKDRRLGPWTDRRLTSGDSGHRLGGGGRTDAAACPLPRAVSPQPVSPQASGADVGTAETADQRQAENVGHTVRLEGAQLQMTPQGGQWTPHRSLPEPQHWPGSGPCLSRGGCRNLRAVPSLSRVRLLQPHGLQPARPPYQSPAPGVYSDSCPLSQ